MVLRMTLKKYKEKYPFRLEDFAEFVGVSISHASDLVRANRQCSLDVAVKIEEFTNRKVTCRDLLVAKEEAR